jgi:hypothetical protein
LANQWIADDGWDESHHPSDDAHLATLTGSLHRSIELRLETPDSGRVDVIGARDIRQSFASRQAHQRFGALVRRKC